MIEPRCLEVGLTVQAPVLSQATAAGEPGIDAPAHRDQSQAVVLPGTLIRGKLREAWGELAALGEPALRLDVESWLGAGSDTRPNFEPARGRLRISDFVAEPSEKAGLRYRVQLDPDRRSIKRGHLQSIEVPFAPGRKVRFTGTIRYLPRSPEEARDLRRAVEAGLRWTSALGAFHTHGFGQLLEVTVEEIELPKQPRLEPLPGELPVAFDLLLRPEEPLCLALLDPKGNFFETGLEIPGGALKGALASTWREALGLPPSGPIDGQTDLDRRELGQSFHLLRISHARPTSTGSGRRPLPLGFSLALAGEQLYDLALQDGPCLLGGRAPEFRPDWKSTAAVERDFGWPAVERRLQTHTAISAEQRRAAEGQLYTYELLLPDPTFEWQARIDLGGIPTNDRVSVAEQLREVLRGGLRHLGKTQAGAAIELPPIGPGGGFQPVYESLGDDAIDGCWVVDLSTPVLLADPSRLDESSGREQLAAAYAAAIGELSGGTLRLLRFFARQRLHGGGYVQKRFQGGRPYSPFFLTEAGSVFVLAASGDPGAAAQTLAGWQQGGLPVPAWATAGAGEDLWRRCPFVPENGYGEIAINLSYHWSLAPPAGLAEPLAEVAL